MKRKILIVEDNVGLSQIQKDWLSRAGYDAVTAMSEPIARSLIRRMQFDLILSDVRLPEGDGISLLEWLRKEKKDIPFIITTEYVSVPDVVRTIKLGARDYLPKPVHRDYLLELAEDVFHPVATVRKQERQLFHRTSPMILKVEKFARLVAPSDMSVPLLQSFFPSFFQSLFSSFINIFLITHQQCHIFPPPFFVMFCQNHLIIQYLHKRMI